MRLSEKESLTCLKDKAFEDNPSCTSNYQK